jgi:hypothetical protein
MHSRIAGTNRAIMFKGHMYSLQAHSMENDSDESTQDRLQSAQADVSADCSMKYIEVSVVYLRISIAALLSRIADHENVRLRRLRIR